MPEEKPANNDSIFRRLFRIILKDTAFDPDLDKWCFLTPKKKIRCIECDSPDTYVIFEHKYNGLRGHCRSCGASWPES